MPAFASQEYWDARFNKDSAPFDWLLPVSTLCGVAEGRLDNAALREAEVLHIGCGTSDSSVLRGLVNRPSQIHNVDYSSPAIEAARAHEQDMLSKKAENEALVETVGEQCNSAQSSPVAKPMRWSCADLLSLDTTICLMDQQLERGQLFELVLDKSTSDSISCGSSIHLQLPYPLSINGWTRGILASSVIQLETIHPLHILAVHLAALTTPRTGKWITISYSEDRFPFLPPYPRSADHGFLSDSTIKAGFPHPSQLWRLETKEKIDQNVKREETLAERRKRLKEGIVHRPQISHWLYVLVRTDTVVTD